jgi:glycosyltransferase involved in cell wall biosynthesis
MHILIIHQAFASLDEPGGTRHYEFAQLLAARGHQVTVIASPVSYITGAPTYSTLAAENFSKAGEGGITILRARVYSAHHKSFVHRILAFFSFMISSFLIGLGVQHVDLVWGTSPPIFQGASTWMLARLKRAVFLFEVRDLWPEFAVAVGVLKNPILIGMSEWLERFLYRHADQVIVNSPGFLDHMKERGARKVELVPNGADPAMFDPGANGSGFRTQYRLQGKFVALYAGAHGLSNDLDIVLSAAKLLADEQKLQIVLLGDGKEKAALQARAAEMRLTNVTFLASIPKSEIPTALAAADACIAILKPLAEYKTTYPNKVFDYMAAGRPVALAIDGVIRAVVEDARCGLFATPGSAGALAEVLRRLARDPEGSRQMGMRGRKYLEQNFDREEIANKLLQILGDMTNGRRN